MSEEILDGDHFGLRIEQLSGHGVAQLVAADPERGLSRIVFDSFLDAPDRDGISFERAFFNKEDAPCSRGTPDSEVIDKSLFGIVADVHDPLLAALGMTDKDPALPQIQVSKL